MPAKLPNLSSPYYILKDLQFDNSIITFWNIRQRDYNKTILKCEKIYQKLDKLE